MNTLLIGPRAAGKTTIGQLLAQRVNQPFVDLDDRAMKRFDQTSVGEIWRVHGERAWRQAEANAFEQLMSDTSDAQQMVIALGGGAPMVAEIRARIQELRATRRGRVVYLRCAVAELGARLRANPGDRPSLTGQEVADEIAQVVAAREPTYLALADVIVDTSDKSPPEAVAEVYRLLNERR